MKRKSRRNNIEVAARTIAVTPLIPEDWQRTLRVLLIVLAMLAGVYFRFDHLDYKTYWFDEIRTLLTLSGLTYSSAAGSAFTGKIIHPEDLQRIVQPEKPAGLPQVAQCIAAEGIGSTHPPLFFILAKLWQSVAGTEPVKLRFLAAIFGILALPAGFLLARELFGSSICALSLMSVSPLLVLMSQEARNYSLWVLSITLAALFLLRALRTNEKRDWVLYGIACAVGLYTHYMMILVMVGFAIFILMDQRLKLTEIGKKFAIASGAAFVSLIPWLVFVASTASSGHGYSSSTFESGNYSGMFYLSKYFANSFRVFWDVEMDLMSVQALIGLLVFIAECWSVYFVFRFAPQRGKILALSLLFTPFLMLMLADFGGNTILSTVARYLIPSAIALILTMSYWVHDRATTGGRARRIGALSIACLLLTLEVYSCYVNAQSRSWWTRQILGHQLFTMGRLLNAQASPVLIATNHEWTTFGEVMTLSRLLSPSVRLILSPDDAVPDLPTGKIQVYLLEPSGDFINKITEKYHCTSHPIDNVPGCFQLLSN